MISAPKKGLPIYVLKVLSENSDVNHPLTQQAIIDLIERDYDVEFERKAIGSCIDLLLDFDFDIVKVSGKGYYLNARLLDNSEITYIVDALFSSKSISGTQTKNIINTLTSTLSKHDQKNYKYVYKSADVNRTLNNTVFYNIEIITEAINKGCQISFDYLTYDINGNMVNKKSPLPDGKYYVSPYYLVNNYGRYYLLCGYGKNPTKLSIRRIDYMVNVSILNIPLIDARDLEEPYSNFDVSKFINEHIYLFTTEVVNALVELKDSYAIQYVKDWFGEGSEIINKDNKIYCRFKVDASALHYWALQYAEHVKVIEPKSSVDKLKTAIASISEKYK